MNKIMYDISANLQEILLTSLQENRSRPAFFFNDTYYTYGQLADQASRLQFQFHNSKEKLNSIGVIANNDFDTYATIVACLLSGITYVPVEPTHPDERNNHVVELSSLNMICSSNLKSVSQNFYTHHRDKFFKLSKNTDKVGPASINPTENPAYILFTSGTTGRPKGVPITRENLMAFVYNINKTGIVNSKEDRFLQIFDLTFDASVFS